MSKRYFIFFRAIAVALFIAMIPLFAINTVLNQFAASLAEDEMTAMAERYIERAETSISSAVTALQRLDRDDIQTCTLPDRKLYQSVISSTGEVRAIGLVDREGKRMCIVPDMEISGEAILPVLRPDGPLVGIGMLNDEFMGARVAVVSWDLQDGTRLFAELDPAMIASDPGPNYLRGFRRAELRLGDDILWYAVGGYSSEASDPNSALRIEKASVRYPLSVNIITPKSSALYVVGDLKVVAAIACAGFVVLLVAVGVWLSWRPESEAQEDFVAAIKRGEFIPYYQPVVDIETGRLKGCEVLMRWQRPDGQLVSPGQFMDYAERNGYIFDMTRHIMRRTVEEVGDMYDENPDYKLSINLFAGHFRDREIVSDLKKIYANSKISFQQIVVEVTERYPLEDIDLARKIMAEIQALGVRVALDDVGTGHGGMAYLQKLGVDIIKIDKMFIDTIGDDDSSTTIVDSMVELADNLGMGIIAEGIEQQEQVDRLIELGVTAAQGYFFAPPMPARDYIKFSDELLEKEAQQSAIVDDDDEDEAA